MTRFTYIFAGLIFGGLTFVTSSLFGSDLAPVVSSITGSAPPGLSGLAGMLVEPVAWLLLNPVWGAAMIGVFWPVALIWLGMVGMVGMIAAGFGGAISISTELGSGVYF
jgi:hypothetical protein